MFERNLPSNENRNCPQLNWEEWNHRIRFSLSSFFLSFHFSVKREKNTSERHFDRFHIRSGSSSSFFNPQIARIDRALNEMKGIFSLKQWFCCAKWNELNSLSFHYGINQTKCKRSVTAGAKCVVIAIWMIANGSWARQNEYFFSLLTNWCRRSTKNSADCPKTIRIFYFYWKLTVFELLKIIYFSFVYSEF